MPYSEGGLTLHCKKGDAKRREFKIRRRKKGKESPHAKPSLRLSTSEESPTEKRACKGGYLKAASVLYGAWGP